MAQPIPPKFYAQDAGFPEALTLRPIGVVRSPHKERHGTPRQAVLTADPALRPDEGTVLQLFDSVLTPHAVEDLVGIEYVWVLAWMHLNHGWRNKVSVPGEGKRTRGLLSTRAPHRPNPIALSAVRLVRVEGLALHVERSDLLDGTPILDIKPYVPYADAFPDAKAGWVDERGPIPSG
ncbi:MAG: tRNA (N6-threonylcarbamoyladenosine(37)-N6)-methyltransferase TrmO [Deltaproteobacteria bacterium]|nr:tRNA (N6-threonylcarbamoyladenosine(37)-N6)-methyltransferase TrmO [Deltaproteobacteria bacterium]